MDSPTKIYPDIPPEKHISDEERRRNEEALKAMQLVTKAADFASKKHRFQKRKDAKQTPYIVHPIGHGHTTFDELEQEFGMEVSELVRECTDDKSLPKEQRKQLQVENAPKHSHRARLIHLADKLYNLQDCQRSTPIGWTPAYVKKYFMWAKDVVAGLKGTNAELEAAIDDVINSYLAKHQ
ncbi:HD domain-containing protein [Aphelenchoides avenae]|nr:HD domain-containing protein [Aphelenchus avenae]